MSFESPLPPYNFSDPGATFLSSSALDFLLIELVPLAYRVTTDASPPTSALSPSGSAAKRISASGSTSAVNAGTATASRVEDEESSDAVQHKLEMTGYRVGQGLVERFSKDRPRFNDTLDVIKFLCKDLWSLVFGKNIDNLKTNHRVSSAYVIGGDERLTRG